jgi:hypothetical protein
MHDLGRTLQELEAVLDTEGDGFELELLDEAEDGAEFYESGDREAVFDEVEEVELASELLGVASEEELDQFFGKLISQAVKGIGSFARSPVGHALGGVLKKVAKTALPVLGAGVGSMLLPGVGTALGGQVGKSAGRLMGLELEGMSPEDQELEVARRIVRISADAAREAAENPQNDHPDKVAKKVVVVSAQKHAPPLARVVIRAPIPRAPVARVTIPAHPARPAPDVRPRHPAAGEPQRGHWVRDGGKIILFGVYN